METEEKYRVAPPGFTDSQQNSGRRLTKTASSSLRTQSPRQRSKPILMR